MCLSFHTVFMRSASVFLDYALWPLLFTGALAATAIGMAQGHPQLAFNLTYFSLALILFLLERARPHLRAWLASDGQELADLGHTALTKIFVQLMVVSLALLGISQVASAAGGPLWPGEWPMWIQVALGLAIAEFGLYWGHRLAHEWPWLWRFHAVHHSTKKLWFFNTGRFHFVDTLKSVAFSALLLALAGAPYTVVIWIGAITAYIGFLTHCNVRMRTGWINYVFNTPTLHRWHHSMDLREGNKNYGENLVLWDLIFGTYFNDRQRQPPADIGIREAMPSGFAGQLLAPFRWQRFQAACQQGAVPARDCM